MDIGIVQCPHCNDPVIIEQLNCRIFRHGIHIHNGQQINPHANQEECTRLAENRLIYGCGKPFYVRGCEGSDAGTLVAEACGYI
jgi:hypothetical protein